MKIGEMFTYNLHGKPHKALFLQDGTTHVYAVLYEGQMKGMEVVINKELIIDDKS